MTTVVMLFGFSALALAAGGPAAELRIGPYESGVVHPGLERWFETASPGGRIWIQFADRGSVSGQQVMLAPRALERRQRLGISLNTPERQPVAPEYIAAVREAGAHVHRVSRWLNAVSVDYEPAVTRRLSELPFVAAIQPVARYRRVLDEKLTSLSSRSAAPARAAALNYGNSLAQIQQLTADVAHDRGYTGAGVLCALFDTGFRKDHNAFAIARAESRLIAEWDFVFNDGNVQDEAGDQPGAHGHGTSTWSALGGQVDGILYGPAYGASFAVAKTEDIRSETPVEEDNWVAAVEWADSLGADVISSSLTYSDWYSFSDYDGQTCVTTLAADLAATLGIVVCNSAGNSGPAASSLGAPVDAFNILSTGSVTSTGTLSSFSSRGPTFDGRIKPEVCARGSSTWLASATAVDGYGSGSGTSFSCPLVAGCAALVREAHPAWNAVMVREAMMQTASRATTPANDYGWGIVDVAGAIDYTGAVVVDAVPLADTIPWLPDTLPVQAVATSLSPIDPAGSMIYSREQGGSFVATPLHAVAGDTLEGGIPRPATFPGTMEYYFEIADFVGFTGREPESPGTVFTVVWVRDLVIGDINHDQVVNATDVIELVTYVFKEGPPPEPLALGEVNGTPPVNSADIIYLVTYVFKGGPAPVVP